MSNQINTKALQEAIQEHSDERLQKDLREWLVYTAPIEVQEIWKRYITKVEDEEIKAAQQTIWSSWFLAAMIVLIMVYSMWNILNLGFDVRSCIK